MSQIPISEYQSRVQRAREIMSQNGIDAIVVAAQHTENITHDQIKKDIIEKVIKSVVPETLIDENTNYQGG